MIYGGGIDVFVDNGHAEFWRAPHVEVWRSRGKVFFRVGWRWTAVTVAAGSTTGMLREAEQKRRVS